MSEKTDIQAIAEALGKELTKVIKNAQNPDEFKLANTPFTKPHSEEQKQAERCGSLISRPKSKVDAKKPLEFFKTGTYIDGLFLNEQDKPLGGIPIVGQMGIVGLSGVGKSIMVQEIALKSASEGKKVVYVTSEDVFESPSPRFDLQSRLKQKADILGLDWDIIRPNLFVFDTIIHSELRDWATFVETYRYLVEILKGVDLLIIDSITLMETYRGALKYRILELSRYNQLHGITAIYVCQRAIEEADKFAIAGGMGVAHNLDVVLCIDFKKAVGQLKADLNRKRPKDQQIKQWDLIHFTRMLSCRLCGFDRCYFEAKITNNGFLKLVEQDTSES